MSRVLSGAWAGVKAGIVVLVVLLQLAILGELDAIHKLLLVQTITHINIEATLEAQLKVLRSQPAEKPDVTVDAPPYDQGVHPLQEARVQ